MKRDADIALNAFYQALASEPLPAIEVRLGRRIPGPILPLAAGVCAAALLPLLSPAGDVPPGPVTGVASLQEEAPPAPQSMQDDGVMTWVV